MELTKSMEDYLESIYILKKQKRYVRIKDIVKKFNIAAASVTEAILKLSNKNLVEHEKYGYIDLTEKGVKEAKRVYSRHKILYRFLRSILQVSESNAENDACEMEHVISKESYEKLVKFCDFVNKDTDISSLLDNFHKDINRKKGSRNNDGGNEMKNKRLSDIKVGETGIIKKIEGDKKLRKRLMDMGMLPGIDVKIVKVAPLGDPIEMKIKGFHLTIRKEDAKNILIED